MRRDKRDVDARNRDYAEYDQVDKGQDYRFAEALGAELFDDDFVVRTCDFSRFLNGGTRERALVAGELGQALREIGFAILTGHGIEPALFERTASEVERLFTRTDLATKLRYRAARHGSVNQGYFPIEETSEIHPDLVEGWVFCRRAFAIAGDEPVDDFWPSRESERVFRELCLAEERLIVPIMQCVLHSLGCDPNSFDARLRGTNFGLRLNYYPPLDERAEQSGAARLLGHEDVTLFTLLPAPATEGLQVLNREDMRWVRLDAPAGSIILNTGDYMQRITNDVLPSTTHRVSPPRDPRLRARSRVSFPLNVYLWEDELLEVLPGLGEAKYPPVRAIEFHTRTTAKYYGDDYAV